MPGALLIIGSSMAEIDLVAAFKSVRVYAITAIRLFFVPLIVFGFFKAVAYFIPLDPLVININTVIIGMSVASYGICSASAMAAMTLLWFRRQCYPHSSPQSLFPCSRCCSDALLQPLG